MEAKRQPGRGRVCGGRPPSETRDFNRLLMDIIQSIKFQEAHQKMDGSYPLRLLYVRDG